MFYKSWMTTHHVALKYVCNPHFTTMSTGRVYMAFLASNYEVVYVSVRKG